MRRREDTMAERWTAAASRGVERIGADRPMRVNVRRLGAIPAAAAEAAGRRLVFALDRFSRRVRSLYVRLSDVNGPRGGSDKRCTIVIRLDGSRRLIVVDDVDADVMTAIGRGADRAAQAVTRALDAAAWRQLPAAWR
jgi:hypothetical protein